MQASSDIAKKLDKEANSVTRDERRLIKAAENGEEVNDTVNTQQISLKDYLLNKIAEQEVKDKAKKKNNKREEDYDLYQEEADYDQEAEVFDNDDPNEKVNEGLSDNDEDSDIDLFTNSNVIKIKAINTNDLCSQDVKNILKNKSSKVLDESECSDSDDSSDEEFERLDKMNISSLANGYQYMLHGLNFKGKQKSNDMDTS